MGSDQKEVEVALMIYSVNPNEIIKDLEALETLSDFILMPEKSVMISDLYLDTADAKLRKNNFSFRVRQVDESFFLTLKGNAKSTNWGGVERLEIEMPWSSDALTKIIKTLNKQNIRLIENYRAEDLDNPVKTLIDSGLKIIQDRKNHRRIRNITREDLSNEILAELAIDSVTFNFTNQNTTFNEVEIESKSSSGTSEIESIVNKLIERYRPNLRRWQHSKLVTGKAIEMLVQDGLLSGLLDDKDNLLPPALDIIHAYITSGKL